MAMKKLSIGVQTIQDFSQENMIYVDKTEKIYELMELGKHNFIIRPHGTKFERLRGDFVPIEEK